MTEENYLLFIWGIHPDMTTDRFKEEFTKFGIVVGIYITRETVYLAFDKKEDAPQAIEKMDMAYINGSQIRATQARHMPVCTVCAN